jgi:hypothetical protein
MHRLTISGSTKAAQFLWRRCTRFDNYSSMFTKQYQVAYKKSRPIGVWARCSMFPRCLLLLEVRPPTPLKNVMSFLFVEPLLILAFLRMNRGWYCQEIGGEILNFKLSFMGQRWYYYASEPPFLKAACTTSR